MEKRAFPSTLGLLSGKFVRHSEAYYKWRLKDRLSRLKNTPKNLRLLDDLVVAYDKLGRHDKAIDTAKRVRDLNPTRYESWANLGTVYIHAGQYGEGLGAIERALRINPKAHFGRERVQKWLVEYVQQVKSKRGSKTLQLPLARHPADKEVLAQLDLMQRKSMPPKGPYLNRFKPLGFAAFVAARKVKRKDAIKGVVGMMRFSRHDHPILLEALADLLGGPFINWRKDAKRLAARALLLASYKTKSKLAQRRYRARAVLALVGYRNVTLVKVEKAFKRELARGQRYFDRIAADEAKWIARGGDVDRRFARKYYRQRRR